MKKPVTNDDILRNHLKWEVSRVAWKELIRFFASGKALYISPELDIAEVAFQLSKDNKAILQQWKQQEKIAMVSDAQAKVWLETKAKVSAMVVNPWVLVQEEKK